MALNVLHDQQRLALDLGSGHLFAGLPAFQRTFAQICLLHGF
eukprot:CAMPEP_0114686036 /NCGR_PEP_ID=MMETSP0191-20121206/61083_1 /TAXON_ID=126664 /ORGANISM="Sorites sp." /LENGTH=41 /DNA_ID= /DNA_START= /DNA_END= /DNA_ORIENTATION=